MSGSRHEPADGWALVKFGAICKINPKHAKDIVSPSTPVSFVPMPAIDAERGEIVDRLTRPFAKVRKGYTHFAEDDVLFAKITPCMENGKVAIARNLLNVIGCGTTELHVLRPLGGILPEWIYYYLRREQFRKRAEANMTGTAGQLRVPVDFIRQSELPLPPILEQRRIVAKIEDLLGRLNKTKQELAKIPPLIKKFRQSVLAKAFTGELTKEWREQQKNLETVSILLDRIRTERKKQIGKKYKEPEPIDISHLPGLPEGWEWTRNKDICYLINGRAFKPSEWSKRGLPIIRIQNLNNPDISFNYCNFKVDDKFLVNDGQLLFAWSGTPGTSFGAHIWNSGNAVLNQHIFKVIINENLICKNFLMYLLNYNIDEYIKKAHGTAGLAHITKDRFENSLISIPSFLEQVEIAKKIEGLLASVNVIEKAIQVAQTHCQKLAQSILAKAFRGELVEQDPDDEPASMLLGKIKSEKGRMSIQNRVGSDA